MHIGKSLRVISLLVVSIGNCMLFVGPALAREWESSDGIFKVEAKLLGFDGAILSLQKLNGAKVKVPIFQVSAADRDYVWSQLDNPRLTATIPAFLRELKKGMEMLRPVEIGRIEDRLKQLRKELRSGSRDSKNRLGRQARTQAKRLGLRLARLKSDGALLPTLSPKDFRVGQIGVLDDDLQFTIRSEPLGTERKISLTFFEYRYTNHWHTTTISRPDLMILKADFVDQLPQTHLDRNPKSPTNQLLRGHAYRVIEMRGRGAARDYVLEPFPIDLANPLITGKKPVVEPAIVAAPKNVLEGGEFLPDLIISSVQIQPTSGSRISYTYTVKNVGGTPVSASVIWQSYYSEDRVFDKGTDKPAGGVIASLGSLSPNESVAKRWSFSHGQRDPKKRHLIFLIDAKNTVSELREDNNIYVLDTWTLTDVAL